MTFEKLVLVARRRGLVRWTHSGLVEQVRIPRRKKVPRVIARNLATRQDHPIFKHEDGYHCVEVDRTELVTARALGFRNGR